MGVLDHIKLEATPDGEAVRKYVMGQHLKSKELFSSCMDKDIFFNGLLYKVKGHDQLIPLFVDFVTNMMKSIRIEAIARAGDSDIFMVLFFTILKDEETENPFVDLLHVKNGKIYRVDNCFDTTKMPKSMLEHAKEKSNM